MAFSETVSNNPSSTFKSLQLREEEGPGPAETQRRPTWYPVECEGHSGVLRSLFLPSTKVRLPPWNTKFTGTKDFGETP